MIATTSGEKNYQIQWENVKMFSSKILQTIMEPRGRSRGEAHPACAPPKIGKNMIFWHKIVIFHTKYHKNFRASLRSVQFF
jgi:hypothetical protein